MNTNTQLLQEKYNALADEVKAFVKEYETIMDASGVYKGVHILFSNLIYKPKVLFVGINPGPGFFNHNQGKKVEKYDPIEKLEYIDERYDYTLAEETKALFEEAESSEVLYQSMKTNCCFFSTTNEKELTPLLNKIMHNGRPNIYREVEAWTKRIIDMVEPEIIICEGKSAFVKMADHIIIGPKNWEDGFGYYKTAENIHVLGYERAFSNILNKEKVAAKINELLTTT